MVFGDNCLKIEHQSGFGLEFNALDALRLVNSEEDLMKVACAEDWQKARYLSIEIKPQTLVWLYDIYIVYSTVWINDTVYVVSCYIHSIIVHLSNLF